MNVKHVFAFEESDDFILEDVDFHHNTKYVKDFARNQIQVELYPHMPPGSMTRHIMRDKHVSSVWCGNINTYCYNTYQVPGFVQTNCMITYRLEMKFYHTVSCRNGLVRDAYHAGQTRIECSVQKHEYILLHYISCFVQKNYRIAYRLVLKSR